MDTKAINVLNYVDSMMIIDKSFNILYTNRFNPRFNSGGFMHNEYIEYINKKYFEVYPELDLKTSTMVESLQYGRVIVRENQTFTDMLGRVYTTNNFTFPIIRFGEIIGAIELSQDITSIGDLDNPTRNAHGRKPHARRVIIHETFTFDDIITKNPEMLERIKKAKMFALDDNQTLIYGETGTGKEMFVRAMVNSNILRSKKFVAQNCAAIPETLFESILFGSVKGAFTGAENKIGLFEMADGGVLFLDELNAMPLHLQAKLLRVLQDGKVRPVGSEVEKKVDVKVIVAMNKNPMNLIKENLLREDLFYRLSNNTLYLTALRDRKEDIPLYIEHFIDQFNHKYKKNVEKISPGLRNILLRYQWPGNVRELRHVLESMVHVSEETVLTSKNLPVYLKEVMDMEESGAEAITNHENVINLKMPLKETLEKVEREYIIRALIFCDGNVSRTAELLDMPRQTLKFRMDKLEIENYKFK
jgi:arginine utilization regulatory protein